MTKNCPRHVNRRVSWDLHILGGVKGADYLVRSSSSVSANSTTTWPFACAKDGGKININSDTTVNSLSTLSSMLEDEELWDEFKMELQARNLKTGLGIQGMLSKFLAEKSMQQQRQQEDGNDNGDNDANTRRQSGFEQMAVTTTKQLRRLSSNISDMSVSSWGTFGMGGGEEDEVGELWGPPPERRASDERKRGGNMHMPLSGRRCSVGSAESNPYLRENNDAGCSSPLVRGSGVEYGGDGPYNGSGGEIRQARIEADSIQEQEEADIELKSARAPLTMLEYMKKKQELEFRNVQKVQDGPQGSITVSGSRKEFPKEDINNAECSDLFRRYLKTKTRKNSTSFESSSGNNEDDYLPTSRLHNSTAAKLTAWAAPHRLANASKAKTAGQLLVDWGDTGDTSEEEDEDWCGPTAAIENECRRETCIPKEKEPRRNRHHLGGHLVVERPLHHDRSPGGGVAKDVRHHGLFRRLQG